MSYPPAEPAITPVTPAELSVGPFATADPAERATRRVRLEHAEADFEPLPIDAAVARSFGPIVASLDFTR